ncbi:MAG: serine protease [Bacteroidetes bacterium]|nr:serine protease [Bacteroidota bacterium]
MALQLAEFSKEIAQLVDRVAPSIVVVHGRRHIPSSGVHWRKNLIVTVEHALRRDEDIAVIDSNGQTHQATLVGRDPGTDIALLKVEELSAPEVNPGGDAASKVGDVSLVVGRSPNSGPNVSVGILSAVSGPWRTWRGGQLDLYIRLGAEVFPGSSGGAVIDFQGRVVGIATSVLSRVAGLAIPTLTINRVVDLLLSRGSVPRPYLGVGLQTIPIPASFREKFDISGDAGMMVLSVEAGSSADKAGILVGDILLSIDDKNVEEMDDLQSYLAADMIGKRVEARVIRGGEAQHVAILVGERGGSKK